MEQRKLIAKILSVVGVALLVVSFFLSQSAKREQQKAAAQQLAQVYRAMGQGNGTGSGMAVVGSNDGPTLIAAFGGILFILAGNLLTRAEKNKTGA